MEKFIVFEGNIDQQATLQLVNAIQNLTNQQPQASKITIILSSLGGSIYDGFLLASVIQNSPVPIAIHAVNHIDSIANVIYLAAKERTAESHAKFYLHGASTQGNFDEKALKEQLSSIKTNNSRIAHFISENSGLSFKKVSALMESGTTVSAQEALKHKIVQKIEHREVPVGAIRVDIVYVN